MDIDPASFCTNVSLYCFESKYDQQVTSLGSMRAYKYQGTSEFMDDLFAVIDNLEFLSSFTKLYHKNLEK